MIDDPDTPPEEKVRLKNFYFEIKRANIEAIAKKVNKTDEDLL